MTSSIGAIVVTAGPTRERIDPVRYISNYSTWTFGYEIAKAAKKKGLDVTLISGPVSLKPPSGVKLIQIESASDMRRAVLDQIRHADCLIMASAVADWSPSLRSPVKIKKHNADLMLRLKENPDILAEAAKIKDKVIVGFALETGNLEKNARKKLKTKSLDLIIANKLTTDHTVFGTVMTDILIIDRFGRLAAIKNKTKKELANIILDRILSLNI